MPENAEDRTPIRVPVAWEKETEDYSTFTLLRDLVLTANRQAQQIEDLQGLATAQKHVINGLTSQVVTLVERLGGATDLRFRLDVVEMLVKGDAPTTPDREKKSIARTADDLKEWMDSIGAPEAPHA